MDIAKRLRQYMDYLGMPSTQFADEAKVSRPTISQILNGRNRKVSNELISKLHDAFPQLNIMWLLFGDGDIEINPNNATSAAQKRQMKDIQAPQQAESEIDTNQIKQNSPVSFPLQFSDIDEFMASNAPGQRTQGDTTATLGDMQHIAPASQDAGRRIKTIMVFYSDNSYEIFKPY